MESSAVSFVDQNTSSTAFIYLRRFDDVLAMGLAIEVDGDLDLTVTHDDAQRIAAAIIAAVDEA